MDNLVCVRTYFDRAEANIAKSVLAGSGIDSFIKADDEGGMLPFQLGGSGLELMVKQDDLEKAREILK